MSMIKNILNAVGRYAGFGNSATSASSGAGTMMEYPFVGNNTISGSAGTITISGSSGSTDTITISGSSGSAGNITINGIAGSMTYYGGGAGGAGGSGTYMQPHQSRVCDKMYALLAKSAQNRAYWEGAALAASARLVDKLWLG